MSLLNRIRWTRKNRPLSNRIRAAAPRVKLFLKSLEERTVPATITVNTLTDSVGVDALVSLREAIESLNAGADVNGDIAAKMTGSYGTADAVIFDGALFGSPQTMTMNGSEFAVAKSMSITGPGAGSLTIDANQLSRHFNISDNTVAQITVSMSAMTLTKGQAPNPDFAMGITGNGGSITVRNEALSLDSMVIRNNKTSNVVGVGRPSGGAVSMGDAPVIGSSSGLGSKLLINNCQIDNNYTANVGGGIGFQFPNNLPGGTGNIFVINNSTVANNTAALRGGGIHFSGNAGTNAQLGSNFSMRNTTVSGNRSQFEFGGGVQIDSTTGLPMSIFNSTITNNNAMTNPGGGGLVLNSGTGTINIEGSIIADNFGSSWAPDIYTNTGGTINSKNNIIGSKTGIHANTFFNDQGGNQFVSANLGPLTNNGGITLTHKPVHGGPAINKVGATMTQTTLGPALNAGATSAFVISTTGIAPGTRFGIDSEIVKVSQVSTAVATTLAASIGSSTATFGLVASTANLAVGMNLNIDSEVVAVSSIPTVSTTLVADITATTLTADITTTIATSCTVASTTGIVLNGFVLIDAEYMKVTNIAGLVLTITRAQNGSTAAIHSTGAAVNSATCTVSSATGIATNQLLLIDSEYVQVFAAAGATLTLRRGANGTAVATHLMNAGVFNSSLSTVTTATNAIVTTTLSAAITNIATQITVASTTGIVVNQLLLIDAGINAEYVQVLGISGSILIVARGQNATSAVAHASAAPVNTTTVTVGNVTGITNGQLLLIDAEYVQVSSIVGLTLNITRAQNGTVAAAHSANATVYLPLTGTAISSSATVATVTSTAGISAGMLMLIDSEYVLVTGVGSSPPSLTIVRGQNGTTAAAHLARAPLSTVSIGITRAQLGTTAASHASGASLLAPSLTIVRGVDTTTDAAHTSGKALLIAYDQIGNVRSQGGSIEIGAVEVNLATPAAIGTVLNVTAGNSTGTFTVTYSDDAAISVPGTVIGNDFAVRVTGPGGFDVAATYTGMVGLATDGTPRTASYEFNAPGTWGYEDNGAYDIVMQLNQVKELTGTAYVPNNTVGKINVAIGRSLVVTNSFDTGAGSLRDAIDQANMNTFVVDTITFDTVEMLKIANGGTLTIVPATTLDITDPVTITGPGITIDGASSVRLFRTEGPGNMAVSMSGMTLQNGTVPFIITDPNVGGAILFSDDNLTLTNCTLTGNTAGSIAPSAVVTWGALTMTNCTVSNNTGGGVLLGSFPSVGPDVVIQNTSITGNSGSGISGRSFSFNLSNSTIANNSGATAGGGINIIGNWNSKGNSIVNSTITGNSAANSGGGIYMYWASSYTQRVLIGNTSIVGNFSNGGFQNKPGGGVSNQSNTAYMVEFENSVIASNTNKTVPDIFSKSGVVANNSFIGILQPASAKVSGFNNKLGSKGAPLDPALSPLANNGGPTLTVRPYAGSPLVDAGLITLTSSNLLQPMSSGATTAVVQSNASFAKNMYVTIDSETLRVTSTSNAQQTQLASALAAGIGATTVNVFNNSILAVGQNILVDSEWMQVTAVTGATLTTLGAALTNVATTATVANTASLSVGQYLLIDAEYVRVTSITPTTTIGIARAQLNSTAVAHNNGATLSQQLVTLITTLSGALGTTTGTAALVASTANLSVGMNLLVDLEFVRVTAINNVATTLTAPIVNATGTIATLASLTGVTTFTQFLIDNEYVQVTAINNIATTVADVAGIDATTNTLTVANAAGIANGTVLQIDSEYVTVASVTGNVLLIVRGSLGSTAAAHANGAAVTNSVTITRAQGGSTAAAHSGGASFLNTISIARAQLGTTGATHLNGANLSSPYINVLRGQQSTAAVAHSALAALSAPVVSLSRAALGTTAAAHNVGTSFSVAYTQPGDDQRGAGFPRAANGLVDIGAIEVDPNIPSAVLTTPISLINTAGATPVVISITYNDNVGVKTSTINDTITPANNDLIIRVTGPNAFDAFAKYQSVTGPVDGKPQTAVYWLDAPGGMWEAAENGIYTISIEPSKVSDGVIFVEGHALGTFQVGLLQTLIVTNDADSGPGSLRNAVDLANANAGLAETITFDPGFFSTPQTIILTGGELVILDALTIIGPGAGFASVQAANSRIFTIDTIYGVTPNQVPILISGLTMTGGNGNSSVTTSVVVAGGGAILNVDEALTINNCVITNNNTSGAIDPFTQLPTTNAYGGGILIGNSLATLVINNSVVTGNTANQAGGGIELRYGNTSMTITNSVISHNVALTGTGGGIDGGWSTGPGIGGSTITIDSSTIANNTANTSGGGISTSGGIWSFTNNGLIPAKLIVTNSTFTGNFAATGDGGAIRVITGTYLTIRGATITGNTARNSGGGLQMHIISNGNSLLYGPNYAIINSVIAGNKSKISPDVGGGSTTTTLTVPVVNSFIGAIDPAVQKLNNINSTIGTVASPANPLLGPAVYNGGALSGMLTHMPLPGSPLLNAGIAVIPAVPVAKLAAAASIGSTTISVNANGPFIGYTLVIDAGLATEETITYKSHSSLVITLQSPLLFTHAIDAVISRVPQPATPAFDQRGTGYNRQFGTLDIGAIEVNPAIPVANGTFAPMTVQVFGNHSITITYTDDVAMSFATILNNNSAVRITGPGGFNQLAKYVSATPGTGAAVEAVTYSFTPPGGGWDKADNGTYTVSVETAQISDGTNFVFGAAIGSLQVAIPFSLVVDTIDDTDDAITTPTNLSIREAIRLANESVGTTETITFSPSVFATQQIIGLNFGTLSITDPVVITGPGASLVTIDGLMTHRVMSIAMTPAYWSAPVSISGMTFANGRNSPSVFANAAGITNETAILTIDSCELTGMTQTANGGAIAVITHWAGLTVKNSKIYSNSAGAGGGIVIGNGGTGVSTVPTVLVTIDNTIFDSNQGSQGGALNGLIGANFVVTNSTFTNNFAGGAFTSTGGAIFMSGATFTMSNSTVSNNTATGSSFTATGNGGGLAFEFGAIATLNNNTITGNTAAAFSTGGSGGGIFINTPSNVTINGGSIANNQVGNSTSTTAGGGGIFLSGASTVTINNAVIADNTANGIGGGILASNMSTAATASGTLIINGSTISGNVTLSPLANTGGGGLFVNGTGGMTLITNSTISSNFSSSLGGGILAGNATAMSGHLTVRNSTIAFNTATTGGGVNFNTTSGTVTTSLNMFSTIVSDNTATTGANVFSNSTLARINVGVNTLFGTAADGTGTINGTPIVSAGANLGGLANNGGLTPTRALLVGSTALNVGTHLTNELTTLSAAMTALDTTFAVANAAALAFLGVGQRIKIDSEVMTISSINTVTFVVTVNRAQDLTTAAAHAMGASVTYSSLLGSTDQRGVPLSRVVGAAADIGAYELQPPKVSSVLVNGVSGGQRSNVSSIVINFSEPVTFSGNIVDAFTLTRQNAPLAQTEQPGLNGLVNITASPVSGTTSSVTLTFLTSGANPIFGVANLGGASFMGASLPDGTYDLNIDALQISANGGLLDGNADFTAGDDFDQIGSTNTVNDQYGLFRLFGDTTGDGSVAVSDFNQFKGAFSNGANAAFDYDNDGDVAIIDFNEFKKRNGSFLP